MNASHPKSRGYTWTLVVTSLFVLVFVWQRSSSDGQVQATHKTDSDRQSGISDTSLPRAQESGEVATNTITAQERRWPRKNQAANPPLSLGPELESESEALRADAREIAAKLRLDPSEVQACHRFRTDFTELVAAIRQAHPEKLSGTWLEPMPSKTAHLRIVGDLSESLKRRLQTLKPKTGRLRVHTGGRFSEADLADRLKFVSDVAKDAHIPILMITSDVQSESVLVHMQDAELAKEFADQLWDNIMLIQRTLAGKTTKPELYQFQRGVDLFFSGETRKGELLSD